jgi:PAS domain S-box-containing protein
MEEDKIELRVLLDIALEQRITGNLDESLSLIFNTYLSKLNCDALAIYNNREWAHFTTHLEPFKEDWKSLFDLFSQTFIQSNVYPIFEEIERFFFYAFSLGEPGLLVLIRKGKWHQNSIAELSKIVKCLGLDIYQIKESQRLTLLQQLFDQSSDAIQISEENGKLYYINQTAAERLGIAIDQVSKYTVGDFEILFQNQEQWQAHIAHLKNHGQIVIEGVNVHQSTGQKIPVEVTASLIEINAKRFVIAISRDITQRKQQDEQLKQTTAKLESIFNEMSDVVWSASVPDFKMVFVTPSVSYLYGITIEQWMADSEWWQKAIYVEDRAVVTRIFDSLEKYGEYNEKYRIITPSGNVKWVRNRGKYIYNQNHEAIRLDGVIMDRTAHYQAQENLEQELRLQEALIDIASTYINLDPKDLENTIKGSLEKMGLFVEADRAYIFDYDFEKQTTSNTYEWCQIGISPEIENLQNVPMEFFPQWVTKHQNGEAFYVPNVSALNDETDDGLKSILEPQGIKSLIAIPMLDGKELIGFVGFDSVAHYHDYSLKEQRLLLLFGQMLINIRNRQKWDNQLRLQEEKYRNIIANMNLGLIEVNNQDQILFANQSFCEMSGFSLEELKGKTTDQLLLNNEQRTSIFDTNNQRKKGITDSYELEITNKRGQKKYWFISGAPNYNDKGQRVGSIGVHLDISAQKLLEQDLAKAKTFAEAAAKAKELFLANMSHEIRTPLNVIIGMIRQLSKENLTSEQHTYVQKSESSARHLLTILNNVLDIAKIESGDMEISHKPFSPSALAYNVHSIMYAQAREKNLDFKINVSPQVNSVLEGDEIRLKQVLINLIGNAIKFTDKGDIKLSVELLNESFGKQQLKFEVTDTGIGMSSAFVSKIFDKFSQEFNASNRKYEGTGLGMAISNDLVQLMGGEMTVTSEKDKGTSCIFTLTLLMSKKEAIILNDEMVNAQSFKGMKALLVEDSEMNRFIAIQSLDYLGFETIEAENGKIAIEKVQHESFDLILMDIQMPIIDGVQATIEIREKLKINTPIIALTANAFKHDIDLYLSKGMNDFITKPYDEQDFFRKIEHVLQLAKLNY